MTQSPLAFSPAHFALGRPCPIFVGISGKTGPLAWRAREHASASMPVGGVAAMRQFWHRSCRVRTERGWPALCGAVLGALGVAASGLRSRRLLSGGRRCCSARAWMYQAGCVWRAQLDRNRDRQRQRQRQRERQRRKNRLISSPGLRTVTLARSCVGAAARRCRIGRSACTRRLHSVTIPRRARRFSLSCQLKEVCQ